MGRGRAEETKGFFRSDRSIWSLYPGWIRGDPGGHFRVFLFECTSHGQVLLRFETTKISAARRTSVRRRGTTGTDRRFSYLFGSTRMPMPCCGNKQLFCCNLPAVWLMQEGTLPSSWSSCNSWSDMGLSKPGQTDPVEGRVVEEAGGTVGGCSGRREVSCWPSSLLATLRSPPRMATFPGEA